MAGAATLEICGLTGFSLDYSNIIALPALLGVGVAFKIYYVLAWRGGEANFLQSSLTRAVFFSALMTATAFGSLWFSGHPAFASMGKLLALSLACTLALAALFQPALMGPPANQGRRLQPKLNLYTALQHARNEIARRYLAQVRANVSRHSRHRRTSVFDAQTIPAETNLSSAQRLVVGFPFRDGMWPTALSHHT